MKVTPVASPHAIAQTQSTGAQTNSQEASRARAIEMLTKSPQPTETTQQMPVQNSNAVSPEEMSAIRPQDTSPTVSEAAEQKPTAEPEKDPALSRQFAQLARQERALRAKVQQQEQAIKAREAALEERERALKSQVPDLSQYVPKDRLKQDYLGVLEELGGTYDDVVQQAMTRQPTDPRVMRTIQSLQDEIRTLKTSNEESAKAQEERQTQAYQAALNQIRRDAESLVKSDPEAYEAIAKTGRSSINDIVELIEREYKDTGIVMDTEDAAKLVEDYLVEESLKMAKKINKIKRQLASSSAPMTQDTQKQQPNQSQQQPMKTLTNATSSNRKLSAKERAILAFKGELKG